jgi:hypothetical protein
MSDDGKVVKIKDGGRELQVRVLLEGSSSDGLDLQALAQEAWHRPGRMLRKGNMTVIVARAKR